MVENDKTPQTDAKKKGRPVYVCAWGPAPDPRWITMAQPRCLGHGAGTSTIAPSERGSRSPVRQSTCGRLLPAFRSQKPSCPW
jgi:hypothetical protein